MIVTTDNGAVVVQPLPGVDPTDIYSDIYEGEVTTPPSVEARLGFAMTWIGTDGSEWDLGSGPVRLISGARGYGYPEIAHRIRQRLGDGASRNGGRVPPRDLFLPMLVDFETLDVDAAFFAGLNPWQEVVHRVTAPDGTWREIVCHYVEGAEGQYDVDPHVTGSAIYPLRMSATDNPYWQGPPVRFEIKRGTATSPFPGPPFTYAPRLGFSDASIINPGDGASHLVGRFEGPFTSFDVMIGDTRVAMRVAKAAGQWVDVDMRPGRQSYRDETGADMRKYLTSYRPAPIPPGETTLTMQVEGDGPETELAAWFTPNYLRAWG